MNSCTFILIYLLLSICPMSALVISGRHNTFKNGGVCCEAIDALIIDLRPTHGEQIPGRSPL